MINETDLISEQEKTETSELRKNFPVLYKKDELKIIFPAENTPSSKPKEFPVNKWTMPPEPQGYIKFNDNDCL